MRRSIEARFATMFYGVLYPDGRLSYCNAGHESPIIVGSAASTEALDTGGVVLGLFDTATYEAETIQLAPGDVIVVSSDGVTEARNVQNEEFGRERIVEAVAGTEALGAEEVLDRLLAAVRKFTLGAAQADDLTALVMKYRP
jgi:serine phosphatase RsbU (regulator of sigma subunit)